MTNAYDSHDKYTELIYAADGDAIALAVLDAHKPDEQRNCSSGCAYWYKYDTIEVEFPCDTVKLIADLLKVVI